MRIRPFRHEDAPALARLFHDAVHQIAGQHYSPAQVLAWAPRVPEVGRIAAWAGDGRLFLVAVTEDDVPIAFADLEHDGHIDHFFCRPDHAGTGVAAVLFRDLERHAREAGQALLYVEASEPARRFFLRTGFHVDHRRDFVIGDVPIHNYRMEKRLLPDHG